MDALLRDNATEKQDIAVLFQSKAGQKGQVRRLRWVNAVFNPHGLAVIGVSKILLHTGRQHDDLVCILGGHTLAKAEKAGGKAAPLGSLPVQAMNGDHAFFAKALG